MRNLTFVSVAAFALVAAASINDVAAAQEAYPLFRVTEIGLGCNPLGMNNLGDVVGLIGSGPTARGFYWKNGKVHKFPTDSQADHINDNEEILVDAARGDFLWTMTAGFTKIRPPAHYGNVFGSGINNSGVVVGYAGTGGGGGLPYQKAIQWTVTAGTQIVYRDQVNNVGASGINDEGAIIVSDGTGGFLIRDGKRTRLPSFPLALNNNNEVILQSGLWSNNKVTAFPSVQYPYNGVQFNSINDSSMAVGGEYGSSCGDCFAVSAAVIWKVNSQIQSFDNLISPQDRKYGSIHFTNAIAINKTNQVAVSGCYTAGSHKGECGAFLLTPGN